MQLVNLILVVVLVVLGVGLLVTSIQCFRGRMTLNVFGFTILAILGLMISAGAKLVEANRGSGIGVAICVVALYMLERHRRTSLSGATNDEPS